LKGLGFWAVEEEEEEVAAAMGGGSEGKRRGERWKNRMDEEGS
jgi:hypothetical protein